MKKADIKPLPNRSRTPQQLCAALAKLFEAHPELWGQGKWGHKDVDNISPPKNCVCVLTGLDALTGRFDGVTADGMMASTHFALVNKLTGDPTQIVTPVAEYNDVPGRTVSEIIDGLKRAAKTKPSKKLMARFAAV